MIDVIIPTLWRSARLHDLVANIHDTTVNRHQVTFVVEDFDTETIALLDDWRDPGVRYVVNDRAPSCLGAFNAAIPHIEYPYWFAGGDDIKFHAEWDTLCLGLMVDPILVVGTNDLFNSAVLNGRTATHFLVDSRFNEQGGTFEEEPGLVAHEGYHHDYFDTELCEVAKFRGQFAPCLDAVVEHMHHLARKNELDATYQRNREGAQKDGEIFQYRYDDWMMRKVRG